MPMGPSLDPFGQILRKLWLFKIWLSWAPLLGHHCPRALSLGSAPVKLPYLLAHISSWRVLEYSKSKYYKLLITHGLTLVTNGLCEWETFSTSGTLTHIRITWALSSMVPQVPDVILGSPFVPMLFWALLIERYATNVTQLKWFKLELENEFEINDPKNLHYYLGVEFERNREARTSIMNQKSYIEENLQAFQHGRMQTGLNSVRCKFKIIKAFEWKYAKENERCFMQGRDKICHVCIGGHEGRYCICGEYSEPIHIEWPWNVS